MNKLILNTDGGARGNPGPAGIGAVVRNEKGLIIGQYKKYIGETTNNQAEYKALILGLEEAWKISNIQNPIVDLEIRMDSELIVRQMQGRYKIKDQGLKPLAEQVLKLCKNFSAVTFHHVPRAQNSDADKLVNEAIDEEIQRLEIRD
jgi:ribonuclease HI